MPALRAALGLAPTVRNSKPSVLRESSHHVPAAAASAIRNPTPTCGGGPPTCGSVAFPVDVRCDRVGLARCLHERRAGQQEGQQVVHDVVEHDREDDLVRPGSRLDLAHDPADRRAADEGADDADDRVQHDRQVDRVTQPGRDESAADPLARRADVEHPGPETYRHRQPGKDQRGGLERGQRQWIEDRRDRTAVEGGRDRPRAEYRALEQRRVGRGHRIPGGRERGARRVAERVPGAQHHRVARHDQHGADQQGHERRPGW